MRHDGERVEVPPEKKKDGAAYYPDESFEVLFLVRNTVSGTAGNRKRFSGTGHGDYIAFGNACGGNPVAGRNRFYGVCAHSAFFGNYRDRPGRLRVSFIPVRNLRVSVPGGRSHCAGASFSGEKGCFRAEVGACVPVSIFKEKIAVVQTVIFLYTKFPKSLRKF